jgi:lysophospholipase L1-like esterase
MAVIARELKASRAYAVVPPPPCVEALIHPSYPHIGSDAERLIAFARLREALVAAAASRPEVDLLDFTEVLAGGNGMMLAELTADGCHCNSLAQERIRQYLVGLPDFVSGQARRTRG